jgi:hypothetical protein
MGLGLWGSLPALVRELKTVRGLVCVGLQQVLERGLKLEASWLELYVMGLARNIVPYCGL